MVLVDTSVFIDFFKSRDTLATRKLESILETKCCITPIIFQEVIQGARDDREFELLRDFLSTQLFCYPTEPVATYERAAKMFFSARRKGITIRSTIDCLIAQIAIDNDIALLHDDQDFLEIAKFSALKSF